MRFYVATLVALASAPFFVLAQQPNAFKIPSGGLSATGGQPLTLSWTPTTSGTVSLILRSGSSNDLAAGTMIASSIDNSGSYTWTPSNSLTRGSDYTVEIVDDSDPSQTNYTPYFVLDTTNTVATTTGSVSLGAPSSSVAQSTASATGSDSSVSATTTAPGSSSSATAASTSGSSSASSSASSGTATSSSSTTMSTAASASSAAGAASSAAASAGSTSAEKGAGAKPTAMAGLVGFVALGALVL